MHMLRNEILRVPINYEKKQSFRIAVQSGKTGNPIMVALCETLSSSCNFLGNEVSPENFSDCKTCNLAAYFLIF